MVPCPRSRISAAPARIIANMVTLLMIAITEVNHAVVMLGLNSMRTARLTRSRGRAFSMRKEIGNLVGDNLLDIPGAAPRF